MKTGNRWLVSSLGERCQMTESYFFDPVYGVYDSPMEAVKAVGDFE